MWARHVEKPTIEDCTFNYENDDGRYALFLNDASEVTISSLEMARPKNNDHVMRLENSSGLEIEKSIYYNDKWGQTPAELHYQTRTCLIDSASLPQKAPK